MAFGKYTREEILAKLKAKQDKTRSQKPKTALKCTSLAKKSKAPRAVLKDEIQALLRKLVIARDKGCILRDVRGIPQCNGYRSDGELILQAEHLVTRSSTNYFGDPRNVVCLCKFHHITWKPQYSKDYWEAIEKVLPPSRWQWYLRAKADNRPYQVDLKLVKLGLETELKNYEQKSPY